jgi:hypothetical protein
VLSTHRKLSHLAGLVILVAEIAIASSVHTLQGLLDLQKARQNWLKAGKVSTCHENHQ